MLRYMLNAFDSNVTNQYEAERISFLKFSYVIFEINWRVLSHINAFEKACLYL